MKIQLSKGALKTCYESPNKNPDHPAYLKPVLQVLNIKKVIPAANPAKPDQLERYRLIISDGVHFMQAMLGTQLNGHVSSEELKKHGVIRLDHYVVNTVGNKTRVFIVLKFEILTPFESIPKIGSPEGLGTTNPDTAAQTGASSAGQPTSNNNNNIDTNNNNNRTPVPSAQSMQNQSGFGGSGFGGQQNQYNSGHQQQQPQQRQHQQQGRSNYGPNGGNQQQQGMGSFGGGSSSNMPPRAMGETPMCIFPIKTLSPYQNKWTIKARLVNKSDVRHWDNARGQGKLFSCTFVDESGEIRATGFNDAVNVFYDMLEEGKVYYISKAPIKPAKKQFSNVQNEYEMTIEPQSTITLCTDAKDVPGVRYNFVPLDKLNEVEANSMIDVIGVVKDVGNLSDLVSKTTQKPFKKRDLTIVDQSQYEVRMTIWGQQAETFEPHDNPIVAAKGVKLGDFGGRSLSLMGTSSMAANPDIPEAHNLRSWYDADGCTVSFHSYNNAPAGISAGGNRDPLKLISMIKDEGLGMGEKPDYFTVRGTVGFIRPTNMSYPACPSNGCNKKVTDIGNGWRCEKCDKTYPAPEHRYIMSFSITDHTGQVWLQGFNEVGEQLLGMSANEMVALKDSQNDQAVTAAINDALFKTYLFKVRAKAETYQDESKVRLSVISFSSVDYAAAAIDLAGMIEDMKML
ncbi:hypothetical protein DFJ77DRAFT_466661 [Powellomyces hirtus]|nr:hypothetical protein DFJ77DRAFT_466661 [Powellomyces hirtus]